jgi:hypothetical protein
LLGLEPVAARPGYIGTAQPTAPIPSRKAAPTSCVYFKEALQTLLTTAGSNRPARLSSWSEIVQTIRTYKAFSGISDIPLFAHFTTKCNKLVLVMENQHKIVEDKNGNERRNGLYE